MLEDMPLTQNLFASLCDTNVSLHRKMPQWLFATKKGKDKYVSLTIRTELSKVLLT